METTQELDLRISEEELLKMGQHYVSILSKIEEILTKRVDEKYNLDIEETEKSISMKYKELNDCLKRFSKEQHPTLKRKIEKEMDIIEDEIQVETRNLNILEYRKQLDKDKFSLFPVTRCGPIG